MIALSFLALTTSGLQAQTTPEPVRNTEQVNAIVVQSVGDVVISQGNEFSINGDVIDHNPLGNFKVDGNVVYLKGVGKFFVTIPELDMLELLSVGDVSTKGCITGDSISIVLNGAGDLDLNLDYDKVKVTINGAGDVDLKGSCNELLATINGVGDLDISHLKAVSVLFNKNSMAGKMKAGGNNVSAKQNNPRLLPSRHNTLLLDPVWAGFDFGLNMFMPDLGGSFDDIPKLMELNQIRSWNFDINFVDFGVAFNYRYTAGIFTGFGIGWNNFSFCNSVFLSEDPETGNLDVSRVDPPVSVKRDKLGVFYVQAPLMFEFRVFRDKMYIDLGVTGAIRVSSWQTIRFGYNCDNPQVTLGSGDNAQIISSDHTLYKNHDRYNLNPFKLDATLRITNSDDFGFFARYDLLPLFVEGKGPNIHPLSIGFGLCF